MLISYESESQLRKIFNSLKSVMYLKESALIEEQVTNNLPKIARILGAFRTLFYLVDEQDTNTMINSHYSIDTQHGVSSPLNLMTEDIFWITESLNKERVQIMSKEDLVTAVASPVWLNIIHSDQEKILLIKSKTINHIFGLVIFVLDHAFAKQLKGIRKLLVQGAQILTSAVFHQKIIHENETQIKFEQALSDLSGRFINLPADKIDSEITQGLKRIADFFKVETGTLYVNTPEHPKGQLTHAWTKRGKRMQARGTLISEEDYPYLSKRHHLGKITHVSSIENLPDEAHIDKMTLRKFKSKSFLSIPLEVGGQNVGVVSFSSIEREVKWATNMINRGVVIGQIFANALARKYADESLHHSYNEIKKLKNRLQTENLYFKKEIKLQHNFDEILGKSEAIKYVLFKIEQCAPTDATVVIMGETGTGKELIARAVHDKSLRRDHPLIKVDCSSLQGTLIERELFGHEKGAFTGAHQRQAGRFEIADGGTLFLDEIGELPLDLQPKLLRVLENGEFERLGSPKVRKVDIRFIAATNRDLKQEVEQGRFRKDLWYRLFVFPIMIPPLRERKEDIPILVNWFVNRFNKKMGKRITHIPKKSLDELVQRPWTGNVRELENTIERKVITSQGDTLSLSNDSWGKAPEKTEVNSGLSLKDMERAHILSVLKKTNWRIYGPKGAALILEINPSTLRFRIKKLGLTKPDKKNVGIQKET